MAYTIDLKGKNAIVTGASSGLGAQFARSLAKAGAKVVIVARRVDRLQELAREIQAEGGVAHCLHADVLSVASIEKMVSEAKALLGCIDILVNNSGISTTERLVDVTEDGYDAVFGTNTKGAFFVAQAVAKEMIPRAKYAIDQGLQPPSQRIINIASVAGIKAISQIGIYSMSKAAVVRMTESMALEWGRYGINTNAICPGYIETEINAAYWDTPAGQKLMDKLPRKRVGEAQDLEGLLLLLASDPSRFMNGAIISADDGLLVQ